MFVFLRAFWPGRKRDRSSDDARGRRPRKLGVVRQLLDARALVDDLRSGRDFLRGFALEPNLAAALVAVPEDGEEDCS